MIKKAMYKLRKTLQLEFLLLLLIINYIFILKYLMYIKIL